MVAKRRDAGYHDARPPGSAHPSRLPWNRGLGGRVTAILVLLAISSHVHASENRFYFAAQYDFGAKRGFYLDFENSSPGDSTCKLDTLRLIWGAGDGQNWRFVSTNPGWQIDHEYTARGVIRPGSSELWLDGKLVEKSSGGFVAQGGPATLNQRPGWASGPADYVIRPSSVSMESGGARRQVSVPGEKTIPLPLYLFEPQTPRMVPWTTGQTLTVTVMFRLAAYPDLHTFAPFIDRYGQSIHARYPGKIGSDADLKAAAAEESRRLAALGEPKGYDRFGGYKSAGWREKPTGFYRAVRHGDKWWLVSPEGNPCFYTGLCGPPAPVWDMTPTTGREYLYQWLPPKTGEFAAAWGRDPWGPEGSDYLAIHTPNLIRKYGRAWRQTTEKLAARRTRVFGFSGIGKWGGVAGLPVTPVLGYDTPKLARHPDIFDPHIQALFRETLRKQIEPRKRDPLVVGWSLGNEYDEIITSGEIRDILKKPAETPGKRALIDFGLKTLYKGDSTALLHAWEKTPESWPDLYHFTFDPPAADAESLRRFYADRYYDFIYRTVKELDPNHLYFGFWIVPGWWENEEDWRLCARHVDVIGYDRYAPEFADSMLLRLMKETGKPVLCGEFSFPPTYDGERGFGAYPTWSRSDAEAGDLYARWVADAARNPWCVGTMWFQYRDQPLTGRGPGHGPNLVYGEHYAFGVVDVADRPKWDLVTRMRRANLGAVRLRMEPGAR